MRLLCFCSCLFAIVLSFCISCAEATLDFSIPHEQSVLQFHKANKTSGAFQIVTTPFETVISNVAGDGEHAGVVFIVQAEAVQTIDRFIEQGTAFWTQEELLLLDRENQSVLRFAVADRESVLLSAFPAVYSQQLSHQTGGYGFGVHHSEGVAERVLVWIESNPGFSIFSKTTETNAFGRANANLEVEG